MHDGQDRDEHLVLGTGTEFPVPNFSVPLPTFWYFRYRYFWYLYWFGTVRYTDLYLQILVPVLNFGEFRCRYHAHP
ncbi:hypothetical protein HanIR_Chr02g0091461 [Helianthus annuus]|nr:hypothetical protein HanIR_Chr02g0091461 [Helianthus annuus]